MFYYHIHFFTSYCFNLGRLKAAKVVEAQAMCPTLLIHAKHHVHLEKCYVL